LDQLALSAESPAELLSIAHQRDLLFAAQGATLQGTLRALHVDSTALTMGIVDSDAGKLRARWESAVLISSPSSEEFLSFLRGEGSSRSTRELRVLLDRSGFRGRNLLNPQLSNDDIRRVIQSAPVVRGFLHELPGLQSAMVAFENFEITPSQFQRRVAANLFHNDGSGPGSGVGFWQATLVERRVPAALQASEVPKAAEFFRNTVFEGKSDGRWVRPRYPLPISVEGVLHTILDRMSQGTRGGLLKILAELPNADLPHAIEVLQTAPALTVGQLQSLFANLAHLLYLSDRQKAELATEVAIRVQRLLREIQFIDQRLVIHYSDNGLPTVTFKFEDAELNLDPHSPPADVAKAIERLLKLEERINGNPMAVEPPPLLRLFRRLGL
jgi:hypothetical protein